MKVRQLFWSLLMPTVLACGGWVGGETSDPNLDDLEVPPEEVPPEEVPPEEVPPEEVPPEEVPPEEVPPEEVPPEEPPPVEPPPVEPPPEEPPPVEPTIVTTTARVSNGRDDAEELLEWSNDGYQPGWIYMDSSDLELIRDDQYAMDQLVGMRFPNLDVPRGATITRAYVRFTVDESNSGATSLRISGQAADNAGQFNNTRYDLSRRAKTRAVVSWNNLPAWSKDQRHDSPNLATVVQEIIDRSSWARGNALVLFVEGSGERTAESYEGSSSKAPQLHVEYEAP